jgi:adenylate cyclase
MWPSAETTIANIFNTPWNITRGLKVPTTEDVVLRNGGKRIDATYLYADLADSSKLAQTLLPEAAAKIVKAYVNTATRMIRSQDGEIRSFDGDRVMAIFMGDNMNNRAVRAAMGINWAVQTIIPEHIKKSWTDGINFCDISHGVGIDTGEAVVVRGGIRDNNDLISIGAAPNVAAKLSEIRNTQRSLFITDRVKNALTDEYLTFGNRQNTWTAHSQGITVGGKYHVVHGSGVWWEI